MKRSKLLFLLAMPLTVFTYSACNEAQEEKMEETAANIGDNIENVAGEVKDEVQDFTDNMYVSAVIKENSEVIELLKMGEMNGGDEIKMISPDLLAVHMAIDQQFKNYAKDHSIDYKVSNDFDDLERMSSGHDWDEEWFNKMENSTDKLVRKFERKADNANDPTLKSITQSNLSAVKSSNAKVKAARM